MNTEFDRIYGANEWGHGSGVGSLALNTIEYMTFLQTFIQQNSIRSVVDLGCGDWQFSQFIDWGIASYLGLDVVEVVIERNIERFSRDGVRFATLASEEDFPECDLAICKDVFQHLPIDDIRNNLRLMKSRARFLLITNDEWPRADLTNTDISPGHWRPVRLSAAPFNEIAPIVLAWTIKWGVGTQSVWNPTGKTTALILGDRI